MNEYQKGLLRKEINLDISYICTLQCPRCRRQGIKGTGFSIEGQNLSLEGFKKIAKYFTNTINFCGQLSDPIFNPHFIEFLKITKEYNTKKVIISTAASSKKHKQEWYEKSFEANPKALWRFGLDGKPEDSSKYRIGQDGPFLWEMMKIGAKRGIRIEWQCIVFAYNENYLDELKIMAKDNNIKFRPMYSSRWGGEDFNKKFQPKNKEYFISKEEAYGEKWYEQYKRQQE